ncbi:MAG TPA: GH92 family glycosyl hydrolase [Candidatus Brocadiia bacterium]|nr:GH92 family glycosyl hydrolase [Candidatus Brocadiia bacterium]
MTGTGRCPHSRAAEALCVAALAAFALMPLAPARGIPGLAGIEAGEFKVNAEPGELGAMVNVFSGTGGITWVCATNSPAATLPFSRIRLGADTASGYKSDRLSNQSGYYYGDKKIIGFSHTRLIGAWAEDGGHVRIFPTIESRVAKARAGDRSAAFSHAEEKGFPGYYAVRLLDDDILAEVTLTPRVGVHRYAFGKGEPARLLVEASSVLGNKRRENGYARVLPDKREIEGSARTFGGMSGRPGGLDVYFVARFSKPFASHAFISGKKLIKGAAECRGDDLTADLAFDLKDGDRVIEAQVAISSVSIENARKNLEAEAAGKSFDEILAAAKDAWEKKLSVIRVKGGTQRQRRIFYTALYRALQMPTLFTDVNGEYRGFDKAVHKAEGFTYYTDFSLWDTFRAVHPLFNIIARTEQRDMMVSLIEMAKAGGSLPRWPAGCGYTGSMMGSPADIAITEAYLKGIRDLDIEAAFKFMKRTALEGSPPGCDGRDGFQDYNALGYVPSEKHGIAVSLTLEFAYADHAISLLAKELGKEEDAALFAKHAQFYRNLWNPETQHLQPKDSAGAFMKDFRPLALSYTDIGGKYTDDYCEGSPLQWRWFVPHDPDGLISLFKSREYFVSELNEFFEKSTPNMGAMNPGSYYWHGNEPDIHSAYLFNAAGRPDLTQKWARWILDTRYEDNSVGLDGNDDCGTLSAWHVLSAMGFFPIAGTTRYELGSPIFEEAEIRIGDKVLKVIARNYSPENIYATKVILNGKVLDKPRFEHKDIAEGGTLEFEMAAKPAK